MPFGTNCADLQKKVQDLTAQLKLIQDELSSTPGGKEGAHLRATLLARQNSLETQISEAKVQLQECLNLAGKIFTIKGTADPGLSAIDNLFETFMKANSVSAAQFTAFKNGSLKINRAYTYADSSFPKTLPTTVFRVASCSKAFAQAAIQVAYDANLVTPATKVFPLLGITSKAVASQSDSDIHLVNQITVDNLVQHALGWVDKGDFVFPVGTPLPAYIKNRTLPSLSYDPVFALRDIAGKMGLHRAPTKKNIAHFMFGEPLQYHPGDFSISSPNVSSYLNAQPTYSNLGYLLLGLVVENVTGLPFIDYVRQNVLAPIGVTDVFLGRMFVGRHPREVSAYDDPGSGPTSYEPDSQAILPYTEGGSYITELMDSGGGLIMTSHALANFAGHFPAWGNPQPHVPYGRGGARTGGMAGVAAEVASQGSVDYAYIMNATVSPQRNKFESDLSKEVGKI